jgi:HD-GYP domain-containing protein (c-di-GMP phosphodiesterase class II)
MQFVAAKDVREGMYVAADVRDDLGRTLIARGQRMGPHHVVRLRKFRIEGVFIDPNHGEKVERPQTTEIRERCVNLISDSCRKLGQEFADKRIQLDIAEMKAVAQKLLEALLSSRKGLVTLLEVSAGGNRLFQHSTNTAVLAAALAIDLRVPEALIKDLITAMLFHDIGTLFMPEDLVQKQTLPTAQESETLRKHPELSCEYLTKADSISPAAVEIILRHHEFMDGSGYPHSLGGDRLSIAMRIASVVEMYDSLTSPMFGQPPALPDAALSYLISNAGKRYAPEVIAALSRRIALYPEGCAILMNTGEVGVVAGTLPAAPMRPMVLVQYDRRGRKLGSPMIVDLTKDPDRSIVRSSRDIEELLASRASATVVAPARPVNAALAMLG